MRILVIGAGATGAAVIKQLRKNPELTVVTADPRPNPAAVAQGVIENVDIREPLTPFNLDAILAQAQPDLVLLTRAPEDLGLGDAPGMDLFSESLGEELEAISTAPLIRVERE